ncbi:MAG TPA: proteasome assembly chaperone family protein [Candidatus Deferrimicrobium sp.]|nr:proteasome assembly chaperone family protein [Candidatus Deferrimicrobium sp.]
MKHSFIKYLEKPAFTNPILIVGLPGVGDIGKFAAEHLIKQLNAKKLGVLYSPHFPYHVLVSENGVIRLLNNEFFYYISQHGKNDLIILNGDYQSQTIFGQYEVADLILELCKDFNVKKIISIGGYATGNIEEHPKIFGAVNHASLNNLLKELAVEPCDIGSPIVGAVGLLVGLARFHNIDGICILGETPGYIVDPRCARIILSKILPYLKLEIDLSELDIKDQEIKEKTDKIQDLEKEEGIIQKLKEKFIPNKEDLSYFG